MSELARFGVSIEEELLEEFDGYLSRKTYANRSEAIRDLIRSRLAERDWEEHGGPVAGGIVLVYDHHKRELMDRLLDLQHDAMDVIVSNLHVHLDHHHCMEVIAVRGDAARIYRLVDGLRGLKGVHHCSIARVGLD
jgi:CopG family nickel-responsive transcriptional regulator